MLQHEGQFDNVILFTDDTPADSANFPTLNNIKAKLNWLKSEIKPDDTFVFTFSGHGISDDQGNSYLVTYDSVISDPYIRRL